ncbi:hypothetical protein [Desulfoplanes formicivorans]|uniref:Uncharacterized protein n=1 Tax=Desulfoplanes formicivorans TaxID=1592317 RepID=A0A194AHY2_9BACT|nr:hypothetical protein [Desulfoplanes formicivorans]GAU09687.1 hypothetical protein DPF_2418 [Desulfoplanes formicivorans]
MKHRIHEQLARAIEAKNQEARALALEEIKALKKDLLDLEKVLAGKKKHTEMALMDITCGAFEVYKNAALIFQNMEMLEGLQQGREEAKMIDYMERRGARLLKKPEGWHWFSPQGEMVFLGEPDDPMAAGEKLKSLVARKPKTTSRSTRKKSKGGTSPSVSSEAPSPQA